MGGYKPHKITGLATGLVQDREEFLLPEDGFPVLENAYIFRERIKRRQGLQLVGRLRRLLTSVLLSTTISSAGAGNVVFNIFTGLTLSPLELNPELEIGSITPITIVIGAPISQTLTDTMGLGFMQITPAGIITGATINYVTGNITLTFSGASVASTVTVSLGYYPNLPVMGLRTRELNSISVTQTIAFDQVYAYIYQNGWEEWIPGTTWTGNNSNFFWSTNYWTSTDSPPIKLFWVTNDSGLTGDPIRYTNGITWTNFAPQVDAKGNLLNQCLILLPFRGRLLALNTLEGLALGTSTSFSNRVRWAAIGSPFTANAWRDDIRGQGGFLNLPTTESIIAAGFVRDNLVIYCENSTWQLRYTGRSIAPFQIEKVNTELGSQSTFSAVQFDTSLVGIGDKGVVECDSFKSERIDIKIPDLTFQFSRAANGTTRVHGIRDFQQKLAYWTYPYAPDQENGSLIFPNRRLVYNYENDSWAIFLDSLTCLGIFPIVQSLRWEDCNFKWQKADFQWTNVSPGFPAIIGGNQQGYVMYLSSNLQPSVSDETSLTITNITGNDPDPTSIESINHNLVTGQVIQISNIPTGTPFATSLNGNNFGVVVTDSNNFTIWLYSSETEEFSMPQVDATGQVYIGGGQISVRDGFNITSKKFNYFDEGKNIQLGMVDLLMDTTAQGAITMNVYVNYQMTEPVNTYPQNVTDINDEPDNFFNSIIPTTAAPNANSINSSKTMQRAYCPVRGNFVTLEFTLSNAQLAGVEQESDVQIDAAIVWCRQGGRLTST
jgi:hypothetical protein